LVKDVFLIFRLATSVSSEEATRTVDIVIGRSGTIMDVSFGMKRKRSKGAGGGGGGGGGLVSIEERDCSVFDFN
jgi:hypothetical protein